MATELERGIEDYAEQGTKARQKAKEDEATYMGHPAGKKPDAYLRMLLFRLQEQQQVLQTEIDAAVAQGPKPAETKAALSLIVAQGLAAADKEQGAKLKATRCFCIEVEDSKQSKWIFACNGMPELNQAFTTVWENGCLAAIQVRRG